jgi:hypothetical protein
MFLWNVLHPSSGLKRDKQYGKLLAHLTLKMETQHSSEQPQFCVCRRCCRLQALSFCTQDLTLHKKPCVKERTPNTPRIIFIAGGYLRNSLDLLEGYNADDRTWAQLAKLTVPRSGLGGAFLKVVSVMHFFLSLYLCTYVCHLRFFF